MANFKIFWSGTKNQNCVGGEIKSNLNSGNVCCHLVQSLCLATVLHFVLYGFETRSHMWRNNVCWGCLRIGAEEAFGGKWIKWEEAGETCTVKSITRYYWGDQIVQWRASPDIIEVIKLYSEEHHQILLRGSNCTVKSITRYYWGDQIVQWRASLDIIEGIKLYSEEHYQILFWWSNCTVKSITRYYWGDHIVQ